MSQHHTFTAYLSGDYDSFYFAVPLAEALALGIDPDRLEPCPHHPGCVAVYPFHLWTERTALRFEITTTETTWPPPSPTEAFAELREEFGHLFNEIEAPQYTLAEPTSTTAIANASTGRLDV